MCLDVFVENIMRYPLNYKNNDKQTLVIQDITKIE